MSKRGNRPPSQRQLRVGELVRQSLAGLLARGGVRHPALDGASITVTEVRMTPDLRQATAYVMPLGGHQADEVIAALQAEARHLQGPIAREVNLKFAPRLLVRLDDTFDRAAHIEALLGRAGPKPGGADDEGER